MDNSPLSRLPPELRLDIIEMCCQGEVYDINKRSSHEPTRAAYNLAKTCKEMYTEAFPIFISASTFSVALYAFEESYAEGWGLGWLFDIYNAHGRACDNFSQAALMIQKWTTNLGPLASRLRKIQIVSAVPMTFDAFDAFITCNQKFCLTAAAHAALRGLPRGISIEFKLKVAVDKKLHPGVNISVDIDVTSSESVAATVQKAFHSEIPDILTGTAERPMCNPWRQWLNMDDETLEICLTETERIFGPSV